MTTSLTRVFINDDETFIIRTESTHESLKPLTTLVVSKSVDKKTVRRLIKTYHIDRVEYTTFIYV
jgi:hypothetical protein